MLSFPSSRRIFLARSPTDMRRGIDTLVSMVLGELGGEPRGGDCFVFVGRDQRRLKVLVWDAGGYWLCAKGCHAKGCRCHAKGCQAPS